MSARDDYPLRENWCVDKLNAVIDMHYSMCDEIDRLRMSGRELERLRRMESRIVGWMSEHDVNPRDTADDRNLSDAATMYVLAQLDRLKVGSNLKSLHRIPWSLCFWSLPHRDAHGVDTCDCVCVLPKEHENPHKCWIEFRADGGAS